MMKSDSARTAWSIAALLIVSLFALGSAEDKSARKPTPTSASSASSTGTAYLDRIIAATTTPQGPLFSGYNVENGSAYVRVNRAVFTQFTSAQQVALFDQFAATGILKKCGLVNAWVTLDGVILGRVRPTLSGDEVFSPGNN